MSLRDPLYYLAGIGFLALAKTAHHLRGYATPKPFGLSEVARCIEYDIQVVEGWLSHLRTYAPGTDALAGKNVLELGPGSDLGIGLYLLAKGCGQYNACDVHDLVKSTPGKFYEQMLARLSGMIAQSELEDLRGQLQAAQAGQPSRLNYRVSRDFAIASLFGPATVDLVFSQAAFEHFDDVEAAISQLGRVCKPGARIVAEIDLKTHTRWIRDRDPNNIYRYSKGFYDRFRFRGIPNRVRPYQYQAMFERNGWTDVVLKPLALLRNPDGIQFGVDAAFTDPRNQMDWLSLVLCATKGK